MPITIHPKVGQIIMCDFSGFKAPEMVKDRPVLVVTPAHKGGQQLVTVIPLSTKEPTRVMDYHYQLPRQCLPKTSLFFGKDTWIKGDMLYTVGFHRLNLIQVGGRNPATGRRQYYKNRLSHDRMNDIYKCVLHGVNLGGLAVHL